MLSLPPVVPNVGEPLRMCWQAGSTTGPGISPAPLQVSLGCQPKTSSDRRRPMSPIEKTRNRPIQLGLFGGEGSDPPGIHGTGDLAGSVIIHRNHRDIAGPVEHLAKRLMSDERMVDRDEEDVVGVGSVEGRG